MVLLILLTIPLIHAQNITTTIEPEIFSAFPASFVFGMVVAGFVGSILIPLLLIHVLYNISKNEIMTNKVRLLYIVFFVVFWMVCMSYALFRLDLILPMGSSISCKFGFYITTNSVYVAKVILALVFMLRIDMAFHNSALGYSRKCLGAFVMCIIIIPTILNIAFIVVTWDMITFEAASYFNDSISIGICTSGSHKGKYSGYYSMVLGLMFLTDMIVNGIMCGMFVYKLNVVVKMDTGTNKTQQKKDNKLKKIMKKQTTLVLLACITSMTSLGLSGFVRGFGLLIPIDALFNSLCVWLMFKFSDKIWNKIIHTCCCCKCCKCCNKEDFMIRLHSLGSSIKSSRTIINDATIAQHNKSDTSSSNARTTNSKSNDIKIDFNGTRNVTLDAKKKKKVSELEVPLTDNDENDNNNNDNKNNNGTIIKYVETPSIELNVNTGNSAQNMPHVNRLQLSNIPKSKSKSVSVDDESVSSNDQQLSMVMQVSNKL